MSVEEKVPHRGLNFSKFLSYLGDFKRYQIRMVILTAWPVVITAMHALSLGFLTVTPDHRCFVEAWDQRNSSANGSLELRNVIPYDAAKEAYSSCEMYTGETYTTNSSRDTEYCTQWVYDRADYPASRGMDWNWVCNKKFLTNIAQSCYMAGMLVGAVGLGAVSDRYGRRLTYLGSVYSTILWGILLSLAPEYVTFVICRFMLGACHSGVLLTGFVIGLELVGPVGQVVGGILYSVAFSSGYMEVAFLAFFVRHWVKLQLIITLPGLIYISYWWFIPESARWLVQKGRIGEAKQILLDAAKENKREIPQELFDELEVYKKHQGLDTEKKREPNMTDLLRTPNMRKTALIVFYNWFMTSMVYWGISLNSNKLPGGNMYINMALAGAVEFPAFLFTGWCMLKHGRRPAQITCMVVAGVGCIAAACVPEGRGLGIMSVVFAMIGKCGASGGFVLVYQYSAEAFPTVVRNSAIGISSMCARIGGILAPVIYLLGDFTHPVVPFVIMGVLAILAGLLAFLLPETLDQPLPETLEDGEMFGTKGYKEWIGLTEKDSNLSSEEETV